MLFRSPGPRNRPSEQPCPSGLAAPVPSAAPAESSQEWEFADHDEEDCDYSSRPLRPSPSAAPVPTKKPEEEPTEDLISPQKAFDEAYVQAVELLKDSEPDAPEEAVAALAHQMAEEAVKEEATGHLNAGTKLDTAWVFVCRHFQLTATQEAPTIKEVPNVRRTRRAVVAGASSKKAASSTAAPSARPTPSASPVGAKWQSMVQHIQTRKK